MTFDMKKQDSLLRQVRLAAWLAWRRARSAPVEMILRIVIGTVVGFLLLSASALAPTALNIVEREANAGPVGVPIDARAEGVRFDVVNGYFEGRDVRVLRVAHVGVEAGSTYAGVRLPDVGEMLVSPAAQSLIKESGVFAERYGARIVGEVPLPYVPGPRSLSLWVGVPASDLEPDTGWLVDTRGYDAARGEIPDVVVAGYVVVVVGFVMPLLALSVIVSSVGFRRREERSAALKLIGFSRKDMALSGVMEDFAIIGLSLCVSVLAFWAILPRVGASLPFDAGVWPMDVAVQPVGAALLFLAVLLLSATLTWVRLGRAASIRKAKRAGSLPTTLGWVMFGIAALCLVVSQLPVVPPSISSYFVIGSLPLGMLAIVALLPSMITKLATLLVRGGVASNWAGRVIQKEATRVSRSSMGIVMLLVSAGVMLVLFPLMSTLNASSERILGEQVGIDTLIGQGQDSASARAQWAQIEQDYDATAVIHWYQAEEEMANVFVVDCAALAEVTTIPEATCAKGVLAGPAETRPRPGDVINLGAGSPPVEVPTSAVPDAAATALTQNYALDGALIVSQDQVTGLKDRLNLYLLRPGPDNVEQARTRMEQELGAVALTPMEMYRISTYSTRQFTVLLWSVLAVMLAVASLSTFLTAMDRVKATRPERRLLAISGADPSLWRRSLQIQALIPVLIGATSATTYSLLVAWGFVRLFRVGGGEANVPTGAMLALTVLTVMISYTAVALSGRLEPRRVLHESPE